MRTIVWIAALLGHAPTGARAQEIAPRVSYVQVDGGVVRDVVLADVNGDELRDLVLSIGPNDEDTGSPRRLQVHLRRGDAGFGGPSYTLDLVRDVVAFAVGDVHANPGAELVLMSPSRAVAVYWSEDATEPSYAPLARMELLWQPADRKRANSWQQGMVDIDGDGRVDLLLPERDGFRVLTQRRTPAQAAEFDDRFLKLPPRSASELERAAARFQQQRDAAPGVFGDDDRDRDGALLVIDDRVPTPRLFDWDGDGDLDVCALSGSRILVWPQAADRALPSEPAIVHELPDRRTELLNVSYGVQLRDLGGDRRAEVVLVSSRTVDDEVMSAVEVYRQGQPDMFAKPIDKLRLQGFVGTPTFDDVEGNGRPDMAIGSLRPDLIGTLAGGSSGRVEAQINLFRNRFDEARSRFQRPVALVKKIQIEAELLSGRRRLARFFWDVNGDGLRDVLFRAAGDRFEVLPTRARGRGLRLDDPVWQLDVDEDGEARVFVAADRAELVVREEQQVIHVEFR